MNKPCFFNKLKYIFYILILINTTLQAQTNLVPNGSFEDTLYCPNSTTDVGAVANWFNPLGTTSPDYYNRCSNNGAGVPYNDWGVQEAQDGNGYVSLITWSSINQESNYREYLGIKLDTNLESGKTYFWCMYVSRLDFTDYASNGLGIAFDQNQLFLNNTNNLNFFEPYGYVEEVIVDDENWTKVGGEFVANGTEKYLIVGNFNYDSGTEIKQLDSNTIGGMYAFYYIDNVYLGEEPCLFYNSNLTIPNVFTPNNDGVNDMFYLQYNDVDSISYQIFNRWGNNIFNSTPDNMKWDGYFLGSECVTGVYYCVVQYYNKELKKTEQKQGFIHLLR